MLDQHTTIDAFLEATAARQPTPGGGAVAALSAAMAAALAEMVLAYSIGKRDLAAHDAQLNESRAEFTRARQLLLGFMAEDQAAYTALTAARKLPPQSSGRDEMIAAALHACLSVPQAVAATALAMLELCQALPAKVSKYLLSDLAIAADLSMTALRCALYNIRVNLPDLPSAQQQAAVEQAARQMLQRGETIIQRLSPEIWRRAQNP